MSDNIIKDFPLSRYETTVDLDVFVSPDDKLMVQIFLKEKDIELYGEDELLQETEKILTDIMHKNVEGCYKCT